MTATATRIIRISVETFCHSSTRICSASCRPMPPAPTNADGGRARIGLDEIENLPRKHGQHLWHQPKPYFMQLAVPPRRADAFDLLAIHPLNRFRKQLSKCPEIRRCDCQHAGEWPEHSADAASLAAGIRSASEGNWTTRPWSDRHRRETSRRHPRRCVRAAEAACCCSDYRRPYRSPYRAATRFIGSFRCAEG